MGSQNTAQLSDEKNFKDPTDVMGPRPQMRRQGWASLNGAWKFTFDDSDVFREPGDVRDWAKRIVVPFAPESRLSGINDPGFHKNCWYEREFECAAGEDRVFLHFGAVDYHARVWVNGELVGSHEGGHTSFAFEITHALKKEGPQTVTVWAEDDPHDLAKPRGKQDWQLEPHSIWYPRTSGIWQSVWLERVPRTYIDRIRWTPHLQRWEIGCEAFIKGDRLKNLELRVRLTAGTQLLADDRYQVIVDEVHRKIALSDPGIDDYRNELLWSPEKPTLIDAALELWHDGRCIDRVESYTALRSVAIQKDSFMLNGRPYYLRLVLDQGYWPQSLMTAPDAEAFRRDIELTKKMGFNGVRKH
ncbi:MAG TPA: hypothetical protein VFV50_02510, partial [Bdellovibrionales bacterium]|nr:hypothetical protein [Bdellovibrionales bacterium]